MEILGILAILAAIVVPVVFYLLQRRDAHRAKREVQSVEIATPIEVAKPYVLVDFGWFQSEVGPALVAQGYEVALPGPEREQQYLQEGWEYVRQPNHTIGQERVMVMGGTLQHPHHIAFRRSALNDNAKRMLVKTYQNPFRPRRFQYISGTPIPHLVAGEFQLDGDEAMRALQALEERRLIRRDEQEYGFYYLTEKGIERATELVRAGFA